MNLTSTAHRSYAASSHHSQPLLSVDFNQAGDCFSVGTESGFCVYIADPCKQRARRISFPSPTNTTQSPAPSTPSPSHSTSGGIGIVCLLDRTNIVALVGGGRNPRWPREKVILWDDAQEKVLAEIEFRSEVKAVKLLRDVLLIALHSKLHIYSLHPLSRLASFDTCPNDFSILACSSASPSPSGTPLATFPSLVQGQIQTVALTLPRPASVQLIRAHEGAVRCVTVAGDGRIVATASVKGTLIRTFNPLTGQPLHQLRRGTDPAVIYSLAFSPYAQLGATGGLLAAASSKGTVHVWQLGEGGAAGGDGSGSGGNTPQRSRRPTADATPSPSPTPTFLPSLPSHLLPPSLSDPRSLLKLTFPSNLTTSANGTPPPCRLAFTGPTSLVAVWMAGWGVKWDLDVRRAEGSLVWERKVGAEEGGVWGGWDAEGVRRAKGKGKGVDLDAMRPWDKESGSAGDHVLERGGTGLATRDGHAGAEAPQFSIQGLLSSSILDTPNPVPSPTTAPQPHSPFLESMRTAARSSRSTGSGRIGARSGSGVDEGFVEVDGADVRDFGRGFGGGGRASTRGGGSRGDADEWTPVLPASLHPSSPPKPSLAREDPVMTFAQPQFKSTLAALVPQRGGVGHGMRGVETGVGVSVLDGEADDASEDKETVFRALMGDALQTVVGSAAPTQDPAGLEQSAPVPQPRFDVGAATVAQHVQHVQAPHRVDTRVTVLAVSLSEARGNREEVDVDMGGLMEAMQDVDDNVPVESNNRGLEMVEDAIGEGLQVTEIDGTKSNDQGTEGENYGRNRTPRAIVSDSLAAATHVVGLGVALLLSEDSRKDNGQERERRETLEPPTSSSPPTSMLDGELSPEPVLDRADVDRDVEEEEEGIVDLLAMDEEGEGELF
ncbi:WD40 repeat-like protein [Gonapodya prolifera JEL478]|uniref:WD40 repeat-like protein n=1 Tax=Gonapodya prolifera (strain JEL478) TaxID=1344416 RepID=A0A139AGN4_GONPJ|nr:WD40 repeat-like protein [Gonapodya prolifera JEL478]|eukprot:KXS15573.1 WD40 repeat-like protein [Gonapodya prolifera JEL478]